MIRQSHLAALLASLALAGTGPSSQQHAAVVATASVVPAQATLPVPPPALRKAGLRRAPFPGPIPALFTRIIDGDTFEARIRVWFGQEITTLVRLRGFDAPELKSRCPAEAQGARQASQLLEDFLRDSPIELRDIALDKYGGRVVATVWMGDAMAPGQPLEDVASLMLATGSVRPYGGGKRASWCEQAAETH